MHEAARRDLERLYGELEALLGKSDFFLRRVLPGRCRRRTPHHRSELPRLRSRPSRGHRRSFDECSELGSAYGVLSMNFNAVLLIAGGASVVSQHSLPVLWRS
jgi:hypothetical protein